MNNFLRFFFLRYHWVNGAGQCKIRETEPHREDAMADKQ